MDDLPFKLENFIKDVRRNDVLYDREHPYYEDEGLKEQVWETIGRKRAMNAAQAKIIWTSVCMRYQTALRIVNATKYIPHKRILHNQNLKFMEKHFEDTYFESDDDELINEIIEDINEEMERDKITDNDGIPKYLQMILREEKLKKLTDTTYIKKYAADKISQYRREVEEMVEIIKETIRRREALKKKQKQRQLG